MLKTAVCVSLALALGACARSSKNEPERTVQPATPTTAACPVKVYEAVAKVRGGEPEGTTCKELEDSVSAGTSECATPGGEKIELKREIKSCAQKVVERDSRPVMPAAESAPVEVQVEKPDVLNVRSSKPRNRLGIRDWVYIPMRRAFGHVASTEGALNVNQRVVALNGDQSTGEASVATVSLNELVMPADEAVLNVCGRTVKIEDNTLVSDKSGMIYKIAAAFDMKNRGEDGKVLLLPQVAPVGMWRFSLWQGLNDAAPVLKDASQLTGVEVKCSGDICQGNEVHRRSETDRQSAATVEHVMCDGAMIVRAGGVFGYADSIDKASAFFKAVELPKTN